MPLHRATPRLSRRSRTVAAIVAIAAAFWMIWVFGVNAPHFEAPPPTTPNAARNQGLKLGELKAGEEIVVVRSRYPTDLFEFRFRPTPSGVVLIISELDRPSRTTTKLVRVLEARDLAPSDVRGVEAVLDFLRRDRPRYHNRHTPELRIEHLRDGVVVGREQHEEHYLLQEWDSFRRQADPDPETTRRIEDIARDAGLTLDDVKRWVSFEMLLEAESERGEF